MMGSRLAELRDEAFTAAYVKDYAEIIRGKRVKRQMLAQLPRLEAQFRNGAGPSQLREAWREAGELLKAPEAADAAIHHASVSDLLEHGRRQAHSVLGSSLKWYRVVRILTIVAAEPGSGKSTWLRSLALGLCRVKGDHFQGESGTFKALSLSLCPWKSPKPFRRGAHAEDGLRHSRRLTIYRVLFGDPLALILSAQLTGQRSHDASATGAGDSRYRCLSSFIWTNLNSYGQVSPADG